MTVGTVMVRAFSLPVLIGLLVLGLAGISGCASEGRAGERAEPSLDGFAARMESTTPDGVTSVAEVRSVGDAYRVEIVGGRRASVFIVRFDQRLVWLLVPEDRTYMTLGLDSLKQDIPQFFAPGFALQRSDEQPESIEGTRTVRSSVVTTCPSGTHRGTLWESVALPGRPVRWEDAESGLVVVFKNARAELLDPGLFEVPDGYTETGAP